MSASQRVVLLSGCGEAPSEADVRFRLTYEGPLRASQGDPTCKQSEPPGRAAHKHELRKHFHKQLKILWKTHPGLLYSPRRIRPSSEGEGTIPYDEFIARDYQNNGYRFVPLVRENQLLLCGLDILFLRKDPPGSLIHAGDIDNCRISSDWTPLISSEWDHPISG
jgi:hypothetical protein